MADRTGRMLISRVANRYAVIDHDKVRAGRFHTRGDAWLQPQVLRFILEVRPHRVLDPFCGDGHLLRTLAARLDPPPAGPAFDGLDLHPTGHATFNDSLAGIPRVPGTLIVTNPPFLARHSAARKRVLGDVARYFDAEPDLGDLYLIALRRCLEASSHVVAILPEIFINARRFRDRLVQLTVLEDNPFDDTDCPVVVACFGPQTHPRAAADTRVHRGGELLATLAQIEAHRPSPRRSHPIRFNVADGAIGLQAVDTFDPERPIAFMPRDRLGYDTRGIKVSSRLVTYVDVDGLARPHVDHVCARANTLLAGLRAATHDLILSPFKGNRRDGRRRRRLDYRTARALLEQTLDAIVGLR